MLSQWLIPSNEIIFFKRPCGVVPGMELRVKTSKWTERKIRQEKGNLFWPNEF